MIRPLLFLLLLCFLPLHATAADTVYPPPWPAGDVTVTIPAGPESESALLYGLFTEAFAARTGKKLSFRHVPGQAGATAWARLVDDEPDGTKLTVVTYPEILLRTVQPDSGIDPENMIVCHVAAYSPCVLWGNFDSLQAFIDAAQIARGKLLAAGPGRYSAGQVAARALDRQAGIKTIYMPYAESAAAANAATDKKTAAFWTYAMKLPRNSKEIRPLAVAAERRMPSLPDTPTFLELGMDLVEGSYYALAVPRDTHEDNVGAIAAFFAEYGGSEAFRAKALSLGFIPMNLGLEDIPAFLEYAREDASHKAEEYDLRDQ